MGAEYKLQHINSLGINLTYACNIRCQFCVYNSNSELNDFMPLNLLEDILTGVKEFWKRHHIDYTEYNKTWLKKKVENKRAGVHFSGGEPFLDFDYVCKAIELVHNKDMYLQFIQSNGAWVTGEEIARERFNILKRTGLKNIFFSRTPFHAEFIPNRNIRIAIKVGEEVFGKGNVFVREMRLLEMLSKVDSEDNLVPLHRFLRYYGIEFFIHLMKRYGMTHHARAASLLDYLFPKRPLEKIICENCKEELLDAKHSHIDPYGNYIPWACGGLSFGKLGRDVAGFFENFKISKFSIVWMLCQENGIGKLYDHAVKLGFSPKTEGYIDKCHLCWEIRKFIVSETDVFYPELAPKEFYIIKDTYDSKILALVREKKEGISPPLCCSPLK